MSPAGKCPAQAARPRPPSAPPRVPAPRRPAAPAQRPRERPPRRPHPAPRPPGCASHLPGPRVRAAAAAAAAPEGECRRPRCRALAVHSSPALPKATRGGAQRQEAAALKPVSAAPDQTARPPRGAGPGEGGAGLTSRPAPSRPIGGRTEGAAPPCWKGPAAAAEGIPGGLALRLSAELHPRRVARDNAPWSPKPSWNNREYRLQMPF